MGLTTYETIMGKKEEAEDGTAGDAQAAQALSSRLIAFRKWLSTEANVQVHSAICVVNGEATDGTRNAPVLLVESSQQLATGVNAGRVGAIDWAGDQALYDRTMGCQVRAVREIKKDEVMMTVPRGAMITPDLVASSDAGRAILACIKSSTDDEVGFWDVFENTTVCESLFTQKLTRSTGPQLLIKILQERKKAETVMVKRRQEQQSSMVNGKPQLKYTLLEPGKLSTRAPLLAFLIQQRFANEKRPLVQSTESSHLGQFEAVFQAGDGNALAIATPFDKPPGSPETFAPYARTLPSSVSIPLCWKRSELALLAASITGSGPLLEVASRTLFLALEFISLLESGLLERFPETFPGGLLTWERWVWAAAIVASRALPATSYIDAGNKDTDDFVPRDKAEFQSPPAIWNELGVMIPLLDMLNHEVEANQVTWQPCVPGFAVAYELGDSPDALEEPHPPRAIMHTKVKKGAEVYTCYGHLSNSNLLTQYGFAQLNNPSDEVKLGWGLSDAVGHLEVPEDFACVLKDESHRRFLVFDTTDDAEVSKWWTEERLALLEKEAFASSEEGLIQNLKSGKKLTANAYNDGTFHPVLLTVLAVATMPKIEMQKFLSSKKDKITLSRRHQQVLRTYLTFLLTRKLEKLLQNVTSGLKDHYAESSRVWTKASQGGLHYKPEGEDDECIGWQTFFESHVYKATMEVESHYYSMGADSCVLTLFDGQLRALQSSLDRIADDDQFRDILQRLEDLGFGIASDEEDPQAPSNGGSPNNKDKKSPGKKKKNKQKGTTVGSSASDRPPSIKLHVGNLSFATTPTEMYEYFSSLYGKDNILECHIPVERDTGRSRGFGFVTMPEAFANEVLDSGRKHEMGGRLVKLAKSNSDGTNAARGSQRSTGSGSSDRCAACGYRPKYCTCPKPVGLSRDSGSQPRPPPPIDYLRDDRDYGYYGGSDRYRSHRDVPAPPPDYYHDDRYGRYERDRHRRYDEGYDDRYYDDRRDRSGERSSSRRYEYSRRDDDYRRDDDHRRDDDRGRKRSRSTSRDRPRKRKSKRRSRSRSPSESPPRGGK